MSNKTNYNCPKTLIRFLYHLKKTQEQQRVTCLSQSEWVNSHFIIASKEFEVHSAENKTRKF